MEGLTRLVSASLARHGFDGPVDYRRLQWSSWFRCESLHSLLYVPSKPGIFALAQEVMGSIASDTRDRERQERWEGDGEREGRDFSCAVSRTGSPALAAEAPESLQGRNSSAGSDAPAGQVPDGPHPDPNARRMLSVLQFFEDNDMAYILDRMLSRRNPMSDRLSSGSCFVRFVVIADETQRRSICNALNQWRVSAGEKASGIGAHFASSLALDHVARTRPERQSKGPSPANDSGAPSQAQATSPERKNEALPTAPLGPAPYLDSGAATNIHCPHSLPSGF
jgi:hypothetical protein